MLADYRLDVKVYIQFFQVYSPHTPPPLPPPAPLLPPNYLGMMAPPHPPTAPDRLTKEIFLQQRTVCLGIKIQHRVPNPMLLWRRRIFKLLPTRWQPNSMEGSQVLLSKLLPRNDNNKFYKVKQLPSVTIELIGYKSLKLENWNGIWNNGAII